MPNPFTPCDRYTYTEQTRQQPLDAITAFIHDHADELVELDVEPSDLMECVVNAGNEYEYHWKVKKGLIPDD